MVDFDTRLILDNDKIQKFIDLMIQVERLDIAREKAGERSIFDMKEYVSGVEDFRKLPLQSPDLVLSGHCDTAACAAGWAALCLEKPEHPNLGAYAAQLLCQNSLYFDGGPTPQELRLYDLMFRPVWAYVWPRAIDAANRAAWLRLVGIDEMCDILDTLVRSHGWFDACQILQSRIVADLAAAGATISIAD